MKRNKLLTAANAAIIMYYMVFFLWAKLSEPDEGESVVLTAYSGFIAYINPFTIGAYLLGVVALLNLQYCQSKIYRIAFFVFYCIIAVCTGNDKMVGAAYVCTSLDHNSCSYFDCEQKEW